MAYLSSMLSVCASLTDPTSDHGALMSWTRKRRKFSDGSLAGDVTGLAIAAQLFAVSEAPAPTVGDLLYCLERDERNSVIIGD